MTEKIHYTNSAMRGDLHEIIRQMNKNEFRPTIVFGIARGGLIPATMLSHYFEVPLVSLNISLRDGLVDNFHSAVDTLKHEIVSKQRILIVDDICDSGATLRRIYDYIAAGWTTSPTAFDGWEERTRTAVLWNNTAQSEFQCEYTGREINRTDDERWIVFDYEDWWIR